MEMIHNGKICLNSEVIKPHRQHCGIYMQLIYRGQIFNYNPGVIKQYRQPRGINWRYQIPGQTYQRETITAEVVSRQPRGINWRYQL